MGSQTTSHLFSKSSNFLEQKPKSLHDLTSSWIRSSPQTLLTSFLYFSPVLTLLRPHWLCSSLIHRESSCFRAFVDPSSGMFFPTSYLHLIKGLLLQDLLWPSFVKLQTVSLSLATTAPHCPPLVFFSPRHLASLTMTYKWPICYIYYYLSTLDASSMSIRLYFVHQYISRTWKIVKYSIHNYWIMLND